jgi:hypothetical protein
MNKSDRTNWVRFSVQGVNLDFDAISRALNLSPTHTHRAGDPGRLKNKPYPRDQWALDSPLASEEPLDTHLKWLANQLGAALLGRRLRITSPAADAVFSLLIRTRT